MTQKDLKKMVAAGLAIDATKGNVMSPERSYKTIAITRGTYGMNGGLFQDYDTKQLYAITARSSALFVFA